MPKRTPSEPDTVTVGKDPWDRLWQQSIPPQYPLEKDMREQGWKTVKDLEALWNVCGNVTRKRIRELIAKGTLESTTARVGWSNFPAQMYRPVANVKTSKSR